MKSNAEKRPARIYFSGFFDVSPDALAEYGAFNVACIVDLPLFIDPPAFHKQQAVEGGVSDGLLEAWYCFREVSQNKLGFCLTGRAARDSE